MTRRPTRRKQSGTRHRSAQRDSVADRPSVPRLTVDEAFIAVLIGAMIANGHVSRAEAERAHHIVWSMKRFRHRSGETVGRLIDTMRTFVEEYGALPVLDAAARAVPARLRPAAFALASDLVLADGRLDRAERRFLGQFAERLALDRMTRDVILDAMLLKNGA
jgi:uncharacterized membrane protein YebE (DUF533 family)